MSSQEPAATFKIGKATVRMHGAADQEKVRKAAELFIKKCEKEQKK